MSRERFRPQNAHITKRSAARPRLPLAATGIRNTLDSLELIAHILFKLEGTVSPLVSFLPARPLAALYYHWLHHWGLASSSSSYPSALTRLNTMPVRLDDDPISRLLRPPPNETNEEGAIRLAKEAEARRISDEIDQKIQLERDALKTQRVLKMLLLGQSESGACVAVTGRGWLLTTML